MTPRQYDLFLTRFQKLTIALPLIILIVVPLGFVAFFTLGPVNFHAAPAGTAFPMFPLLLFGGFGAFYVWTVLSLPYRISVSHDRRVHFKSVLGVRSVRVSDVLSIEPAHLNIQAGISGYVLKHRDGKIRFPGQFTGQYMLLSELKQANPALNIKGC